MKSGTKVKPGTMVKLIDELPEDPMYNSNPWEDYYYLRDPNSLKVLHSVWIKTGEICIVVDSDSSFTGLVVATPRGHLGWIGKEKMEIVK
jgi:hypothetical protein